jgi:catechol 2,3-dioxygenase-like lactoylglutathione lyase family enzyme
MAITLNHTIVPSRDSEAGARFLAEILGLTYDGRQQHFAPVHINEGLTFDYEDADPGSYEVHHYAFLVSEDEFDEMFARVQAKGIPYGSGPFSSQDMDINHRLGGRGVYFADPDGHLMELLTRS